MENKITLGFKKILVVAVAVLASSFAKSADVDQTLEIGGGKLHVEFVESKSFVSQKAKVAWITQGANAVSKYYGKFPVKEVWITVKNRNPVHSIGGTTWMGRKIELRLGEDVVEADLLKDWTATHEMFHLAFPQVPDGLEWMTEGLATYLEPIARARIGAMKFDQVWRDLVFDLPKGLPGNDDLGLDNTHTWGRTYWGGAIFWFLADIQIREKTKNKKSLDTAMRAVLDSGGDGSQTWSQEKVFETCDRAIGLNVLRDLHNKLGTKKGDVNLAEIWKRLGVTRVADRVVYDDKGTTGLD